MTPSFIIEHLDEEFFEWSQHEYLHIVEQVAPAQCIFTNFPFDLPESWPQSRIRTHREPIGELVAKGIYPKDQICLLDSESTQTLQPSDAAAFQYYLLGGILGNVDEWDFDRTRLLRRLLLPSRNLGSMQMPTDTAAICTRMIVVDGRELGDIGFVDRPEFVIDQGERLVMDFRYIRGADGEPLIKPEVLHLIKTQDLQLDSLE